MIKRLLPIAKVYIKVKGQTYMLDSGVSDNLPVPVVLGPDLPVLWDLLQSVSSCNMVVTRAQASKGEERQQLLPFFEEDV